MDVDVSSWSLLLTVLAIVCTTLYTIVHLLRRKPGTSTKKKRSVSVLILLCHACNSVTPYSDK